MHYFLFDYVSSVSMLDLTEKRNLDSSDENKSKGRVRGMVLKKM
jgi:hypothetical protein